MMETNEFHLLWFDPGAAATGWAWLCVDFHAFSRPEAKVMHWLKFWDCGEFTGTEEGILNQCTGLVVDVLDRVSYLSAQIGTEDFELTQMIGGKRNLLSPVRINAVLSWECYRRGVKLRYQNRSMRTSVTRQRLTAFGFEGKFKKDEFAAMQHAVVRIRQIKRDAKERPWKLSNGSQLNAYWDCACHEGRSCDMWHPS